MGVPAVAGTDLASIGCVPHPMRGDGFTKWELVLPHQRFHRARLKPLVVRGTRATRLQAAPTPVGAQSVRLPL